MAALRVARSLELPDWALAAGAVRGLVWDHLHGFAPTPPPDLDLVYFDPAQRPAPPLPAPWELVNQATAHHWRPIPPLRSTEDGIASWPETATCVGLRLEADDRLTVIAPLGLDDLFDGILRPNPRCADPGAFAARLASKGFLGRWPDLRLARPRPGA